MHWEIIRQILSGGASALHPTPRGMRRALMTGFGNARLDSLDEITAADLPKAAGKKGTMGFLQ